ncbi:MAG: DUF3035 domain-containing protein [Proteobacteria bacterium]|nr:DUF3035 domain-containing protein [Pseudomonadota bacterium]
MRANILLGLAALTTMSALAGCGGKPLLSRTLPDETQVIDGPSLAVPPDMQLRPPSDGKGDYEAMLNRQQTMEAHELITGVSGTQAVSGSAAEVPAGDQWLLQQTGTVADPNVREELDKAAAAKAEEPKKSLFKRWFGKDEE